MLLSDVSVRDHAPSQDDHVSSGRRSRWARIALAAAASTLASASLAAPALAAKAHVAAPTSYTFQTIDNPGDPTFNQLLGINNSGEISGYFGSGAAGHPNTGYLLSEPYTSYTPENFPGSVQTQVTGLNDHGVTVGFWSGTNMGMSNGMNLDANYGFYSIDGRTVSVDYPTTNYGSPAVDQLLGVNNNDVAAGFYTDSSGNNHGYTYNIRTGRFHDVTIAGATSVTAAAIDNLGDVAGTEVDSSGNTDGFVLTKLGRVITLDYPGASATQVFGINDHREVVGQYQDSAGNINGFTWSATAGYQTVDDPSGVMGTTVNGVNNAGELVGFFTDAAGNTHGMLVTPTS